MTSSRQPGLRGERRKVLSGLADPAAFSRALDEAAAHFGAGRLKAAAQVYRRLERQAPGDLRAPYSLAVIDLNLGRLERARARLETMAEAAPEFGPVLHNLAVVRRALGDWVGAAEAFTRVLDSQPAAVESRVGLAGALAALGRFPEAIAQNRILAAEPLQRWDALTRIALVDPSALKDDEVAGMQAAAADPRTPPDQRIGLWFALGDILDRRGSDAEAFAAYDAGNRAQRARLDAAGAAQAHARAVDHVRATATPELLARLKGQGSPTAAPIFILGFPRSGSTLVEQILASHPRMQGLGETGVMPRLLEAGYPQTATAARDLAARYLDAMRARGWDGRSRFIDKTLESYLHAGIVGALFPNATILHVRRDPIDNGFAAWRQFFVHGNETLFDLADIGAEYVRYRTMMEHWAAIAPGRMAEVGYEALVADPDATARGLIDAVGLAWDPAALDFHRREGAVSTASVAQVRQPIYAGSVGRWTRHAERLQPLIEALGPYANL